MKKPLVFLLTFSSLFASQNVFDLGVVEIKASKQAPLGVENITQKNMQENNYLNVTQIATSMPGLSIKGASGSRNESMINIRGFSSTRVPIFYDGIPIYLPYDGNMDLGRFSVFDLSQIDISKGASSVLYGPNSLGGSVNLISSKPTKELQAFINYGFLHANSGAKDFFNNHGDIYIGTKQEKFYLQATGSFVNAHNGPAPKGMKETRDLGRSNKKDDKKFGFKLGFTPNNSDEYSLSYTKQTGEKTGKIYQGKNDRNFGKDRYWYWPNWDKQSIYLLSNTKFENFYIKNKIYYDKFDNKLLNMHDINYDKLSQAKKGGGGWVSQYDDYSLGALVEFGVNLGENDILKIAPSFKEDVHKEKQDTLSPQNMISYEPWAKSKDRLFGIGIENIYNFSEDTSLSLGGRFDKRKTQKAQKYGKPEWDNKAQLFDFPTKDDKAFTLQATLEHSLKNDNSIFASIARKTYFPTLKERFSSKFGSYKQNPDLSVEKSLNYELGYKQNFEKGNFSTSIFYSDLKDKIEAVIVDKSGKKDILQNQNIGEAGIFGVELQGEINPHESFKIGGNYSYLHADAKKDGLYITDVPKHKFYLFANWQITQKLSLFFSEFGQTGSHTNSNGTFMPSGFAVSNIKFIYDINKNFSVDFGMENIFNKAYAYTEGYFENGRTLMANFRYKY